MSQHSLPDENGSRTTAQPENLITVSNVGKCYRIFSKPHHRLLQALMHSRVYYQDFWALKDINLNVARGETIGILGQNGSGKSTLLQIVAGTLAPSTGVVDVNGRVAALLELGSGFNPEFTGRENVYLNGSILGFTRAQMDERLDGIAAFAEIGAYLDQPVKTYSSGMTVRLAFSVAINVSPEILIVDEALAVGDARFQQHCMTRIRQMRDSGVSILFVTHDTEACRRLCQRVYVLDKGSVVKSGSADMVANWYLSFLSGLDSNVVRTSPAEKSGATSAGGDAAQNAAPPAPQSSAGARPDNSQEFVFFRHGDGNGVIESCELLDAQGNPAEFAYMDERYTFRFTLLFKVKVDAAIIGFYLKDRLGTDLLGINTLQEGKPIPPAEAGTRVRVEFQLPLSLRPGFYSISPGLSYNQHEMRYMDYVDHIIVFRIIDRNPTRVVFGLFHPDVRTSVEVLPAVNK